MAGFPTEEFQPKNIVAVVVVVVVDDDDDVAVANVELEIDVLITIQFLPNAMNLPVPESIA